MTPAHFEEELKEQVFTKDSDVKICADLYRGVAAPLLAADGGGATIDGSAKWWGPDRHIVMYYVPPQRDEIYFVASTPEPDFQVESWSAKGDLDMLRDAYKDFHPQVSTVLAA